MQLQKQLRSDAPRAPVSRVRVANARLFGFFSAPYTQQRFVCWGLGHRHPHQVQISKYTAWLVAIPAGLAKSAGN